MEKNNEKPQYIQALVFNILATIKEPLIKANCYKFKVVVLMVQGFEKYSEKQKKLIIAYLRKNKNILFNV
jgi:hypothetical protein